MSGLFEKRRSAIVDALATCAASVTEVAPAEWGLAGPGDSGAPAITARWQEPWLLFETAANGAAPDPAATETTDVYWHLLRRQAGLPAACRYGLGPRGRLRVLAEVAFEDTADARARCQEIVCGLEAARCGKPELDAGAASAADPLEADGLASLCEAVGWSVNERPDGRLVGSLPGVAPVQSVELRAVESLGTHLSAEIATLAELGGASRQAVSEVLLGLGRCVRFARATIQPHADGSAVRLETRLPREATAAELRHALAAIAVAFDTCAREVTGLRDEKIAAEYLAVRGETP